MQVEIGVGAVIGIATLSISLVGFVVAAAVKVHLSAREATEAARAVERQAEQQTEVRVEQGRHAERLGVHSEEIGALRAKTHEHANAIARLAVRCDIEHGAE